MEETNDVMVFEDIRRLGKKQKANKAKHLAYNNLFYGLDPNRVGIGLKLAQGPSGWVDFGLGPKRIGSGLV